MTIKEAIKKRHTVRKYTKKSIPKELVYLLNERIEKNNSLYELSLKLVTENTDGINIMGKLLLGGTANNYIILAGKEASDLDEKLGYCGADISLYAQTLGLNTCWLGGMYSEKGARKNLEAEGVRINGVIVIGYGETQGVQHKSKSASEISKYNGIPPQWFTDGVEYLLYAPTAMNRQPYSVNGDGNKVKITCKGGRFAGIDLGIGKYHFEVGAGKENFEWEL